MRRAATVAVRGKRAGSSRGASSPSSSSASPRLPRTVSRPPMKAPTPLSRPESSATRVSASARIVAWAWLALPRARSMRASSTMVTGAWSTSGPDTRPGWAASAASSSAPRDTASGAPFPPPTSRPASDATALPPNRAACSASSTVEDVAVIPNPFQGRAIAWPYDATRGPATIPAPLCTEGRSRGEAGGFLDHRAIRSSSWSAPIRPTSDAPTGSPSTDQCCSDRSQAGLLSPAHDAPHLPVNDQRPLRSIRTGSSAKWSAPEVRRGWSRCLRNSRCGGLLLVLVDPGEQVVEVGGGELPLEGPGGGVVALLEAGQPLADLVEAGEVVGRDDLALHH